MFRFTSNHLHAPTPKYILGDQMKNNELGMARDTNGRQKKYIQGFGGET
jgi:hypothetical protein